MASRKNMGKLRIEDKLFAAMRIVITVAATAVYAADDLFAFGWIDIPHAGTLLLLFALWTVVIVWQIHLDSRTRTARSWLWKRLIVRKTLLIDLIFCYHIAFHTGKLQSPFLLAILILIVFHAYYSPSNTLSSSSVVMSWLVSGATTSTLGFITICFFLADGHVHGNFQFWVLSFFAVVLGITIGVLRHHDRKSKLGSQRTHELAELFRGIIKHVNRMHMTNWARAEWQNENGKAREVFDQLAQTIARNLSAQACEVFLTENKHQFKTCGAWTREITRPSDLNELLRRPHEIDFQPRHDLRNKKSERVGRYLKNDAGQAIANNPMALAMTDFLSQKAVTSSLFTVIFRKCESNAVNPLGLIRVNNRLHRNGEIDPHGFSEEDEDVIQDVAREISAALENYRLQNLLNSSVEKERRLRELGLKDNLDEVFKEILAGMSAMVEASFAELLTPFEDGFDHQRKMVLRAHHPSQGHPAEKLADSEHFLPADESIVSKLFRKNAGSRKIVYFENLRKLRNNLWTQFFNNLGTDKLIAILLERKHEVLGLVCLHPRRDFIWDEKISRELLEFAELATAGIESARYRRRYDQLQKLQQGLRGLLVKDEEAFYQNVIRLVQTVMPSEACSIFLTEAEMKGLCLRSSSDPSPGTHHKIGETIAHFNDNSFIGRVAGRGPTAMLYREFKRAGVEENFIEKTVSTPKALIAAPLRDSNDNVIGVIRCINKVYQQNVVTSTFSRADMDLLAFSVSVIAAVMENRLNLDKLKTLVRQRQDFMSTVAHEFISPLHSIRTTTEFLKRFHNLPERLKDPDAQFDFLIEEVDFLNYLIANISTLYEENTEGALEKLKANAAEKTSLFKIVEKIQTLLKGQARERGLEIRLRGEFPEMTLDKFHVEQVIFNLLVNAIKYSRPTSGRPIEIICRNYSTQVELTFRNWGIGIRKEDETGIFEMFRRGENAHELSATGTGLGLYISRKIVRDLGGDLRLAKRENPTEFVVYLPRL